MYWAWALIETFLCKARLTLRSSYMMNVLCKMMWVRDDQILYVYSDAYTTHYVQVYPGGTVCQLNVETHGPLKKFGINDNSYEQIMRHFMANSDFAPFYGEVILRHFNKTT